MPAQSITSAGCDGAAAMQGNPRQARGARRGEGQRPARGERPARAGLEHERRGALGGRAHLACLPIALGVSPASRRLITASSPCDSICGLKSSR